MSRTACTIACAFLFALFAAPAFGDQDNACLAKTRGAYGFHCWGSANFGAGLEPIGFVGTVEGDGRGGFEGYGTASASNGSNSVHFAGSATFGRHCSGRVVYDTYELLLPGGVVVPLPPVTFDFATVDNGKEVLGSGVAPFGVTGDLVPRMACRLVKVRG